MSWPRRLAWPAAVAAAALALTAPALLGGEALAWRDSAREYGPLRPLVAGALRQGRLPLWDPYDGTGLPLHARLTHGALHPASVALALVAPGAPLDALLVAWLVLAGLGAYAAARALGAAPAAAALAGLGYLCAGPVLGSTANAPFLAGAASVPWVLAAARRAGDGAPFGAALVALATAAALLSGDLQATAVVAALGLWLAAAAGGRRGLGRAAAGAAVGALLAGAQLVPSWVFLGQSDRSMALLPETARQWALSPWRLAELLAPGLLAGAPGPRLSPVFARLEAPTAFTVPFSASVFLGSTLLLAAALGARRREARPLALAAPLLLWLALGHHLGARQLLGGVPVWGAFRYAEKLVVPLALVLALLAAAGAARLLAATGPRVRWALAAAGLLCGAAALAAGRWLAVAGWPAGAVALARAQVMGGLLHLGAGLLGLAACLWLAARRPRWGPAALAALVAAQGFAAAPFALLPGAPLPPPVAAALPAPTGEGGEAVLRLATPDRGRWNDLDPGALQAAAALESRLGYPGYNVSARLDNVDVYSGLSPRRFEFLWSVLEEGRFTALRRYGVTHLAVPAGAGDRRARGALEGGRLVLQADGVDVWAVPHAPWASFAPAVRAVGTVREALGAVAEGVRAGRAEVVVEAPRPTGAAPGRVLGATRGPERIEVEAEAEGQATLVIRDAFWPGWQATLDGAPVPVLAADALVRAVSFPAGRHRVVMAYAPPEVAWGWWTSGAGLLGLIGLAWAGRRRAGARRAGPAGLPGGPAA